jgi:hypothetical protein
MKDKGEGIWEKTEVDTEPRGSSEQLWIPLGRIRLAFQGDGSGFMEEHLRRAGGHSGWGGCPRKHPSVAWSCG